MSYFYNTTLSGISFDEAIDKTIEALKKEGFGVLTDIDVTATLKNKLEVDFRNYRILGACNPPAAYKALSAEDKIGVFLPCNVVVQELDNGAIEIAAVDPVSSMMSVQNKALGEVAMDIQNRLKSVIASLG